MLLRYLYLLRSSWPRALELVYWPAIQMVLWGFTSQFLMTNSSYVARAGGVLLAAVMLWDVMFRGQLGVSMSFLEELWSRNLGHLFVTPLRPYEWIIALLTMSLIRVAIGVVPAMLLAIPLYHYSIFSLGAPLLAFFVLLLVMGWGLGLAIDAMLLRHGLGAEKFGLARRLPAGAGERGLLPALGAAALAAACRVSAALGACLRGYARGDVRACLPPRPFHRRRGARRRLSHARRRLLPLRLPPRPPARRAAANGRVSAGLQSVPCVLRDARFAGSSG